MTDCKETPTGFGYRPCVDPLCPRCHPPLSPHQQATADLAALHSQQWKDREQMIHPELKMCQEVEGMVGNVYLRCGDPAKILVKHRGRDEGPYWMCAAHASHNINNRNAEDVTPEDQRVREFTTVCIGIGSGSGYVIDDRYMPEVYALLSKLEKQS